MVVREVAAPEGATPRFDAVHSIVVEKIIPPMALCAGL